MDVPAEQKAGATLTGGLLKCAEVLRKQTLLRINMASKTMDRYAVFIYRHPLLTMATLMHVTDTSA